MKHEWSWVVYVNMFYELNWKLMEIIMEVEYTVYVYI